jgi:hypothetical protein
MRRRGAARPGEEEAPLPWEHARPRVAIAGRGSAATAKKSRVRVVVEIALSKISFHKKPVVEWYLFGWAFGFLEKP